MANLLSALIVTLGVAVGVGVPFLAAHLEATHARQREHDEALAAQREVLLDYEAELDAYRQLLSEEPSLATSSR
jgi:hypothetical protein